MRALHGSEVASQVMGVDIVRYKVAIFVLSAFFASLMGSVTGEPLPSAAAADPAMYWLIVLLDLGVYVPVATLVGVGLWRRRPWAVLEGQ